MSGATAPSQNPPGPAAYPLRVDATLDEHPSRWLWLVKWLLAIPHYIVLALLWPAFAVTTFIAFWCILVTGRYPAGIFSLNVGIMRWSWRVAYYSYGALGTDRYPPFTLAERPDYPAHLDVTRPERLSRGLVLVKWWLLVIPQALVVGVLVGGTTYAVSDDVTFQPTPGLLPLLVLFVAVALLFSGRYPRGLFDLVLGINRWVLRVSAYSSLMTDAYPPFRLDQGGIDPGTRAAEIAAVPAHAAHAAPAVEEPDGPGSAPVAPGRRAAAPAHPWGAGRLVTVVVGSLLMLLSLVLLAAATIVLAGGAARDDDGYLMSSTETFDSPGHAIVFPDVDIEAGADEAGVLDRLLGDVRVDARSAGAGAVFVGIGPTRDVEDYLDGVARSVVRDDDSDGDGPQLDDRDGGAPRGAPGQESFWAASAAGTGPRRLTWKPADGDWTLVVMRKDGASPVRTEVSVGAQLPFLGSSIVEDAVGVLLLTSVVVALVGLVLLWLALRRRREDPRPGHDTASP
ncbi:DUF4389 domain-containing protein [Nocardioides marmotae]|uniref:DUF4389 domain-containing protein n=1 Tax=Nocardioides marmotae TaxID=2663857 RepID=UPI0012B67BBE|nr:DUF4389 domain-containing protein [Nocardioides marmotae]MBC9733409.1 DUF4389 domain-containing protein [Nocardioides marmotae]MTB84516.1 DUF4389 domain-containing protein [Nocardioides marmotae]